MSNLCIISDQLYNDTLFMGSFNNNCIIKPYDYTNESFGNSFNDSLENGEYSNVTNLALFYHFEGHHIVPFLMRNNDELDENGIETNKIMYEYNFFGDELIDKIKEVRDATTNSLTVDLVSCNLNMQEFKDEVERIESDLNINIRYSIDNTGNNPDGNWVLESDNVNIKDVYFTSDIDSWTDTLANIAFDSDNSIFNDGTNFSSSTSNGITTITMLRDINWESFIDSAASGDITDYINLLPNTIFDGDGNTITLNNTTTSLNHNGLFSVDASANVSTRPIIKNITFDLSGSLTFTLMRTTQKYFVIDGCTTTSNCTLRNGYSGMNGGKEGDILIKNCVNYGSPSSGVVFGAYNCGSSGGRCEFVNCVNNGDIPSINYSGGIVGGYAGSLKGICIVTNCTNNGDISSKWGGGIVGGYAALKSGYCVINNCKNTGNINGIAAGGIAGAFASNFKNRSGGYSQRSNVVITNCYNTGNINYTKGGGITGGYAGLYSGGISISQCYSTGTINALSSAGVVGYGFGNGSLDRCYYVGDISNTTHTAGLIAGNAAHDNNNNDNINSSNDWQFLVTAHYKITNCYVINTNASSTGRTGIVATFSNYNSTFRALISHCYTFNCEYGVLKNEPIDVTVDSNGSLSGGYVVINNFYTDGSKVAGLTSGFSTNSRLVINNSYSSGGSGSNPKYGTSSDVNYTGNYDYDDITDSSSFDSTSLNSVLTLSDIQSFTGYSSSIWTEDISGGAPFTSITPPSDTDLFVYDDAVLLSVFQSYPWSGYTTYNSDPSLNTVTSQTISTSHTVGDFTLESGHFLTHIFSSESDFNSWINGTGDNPSTVFDITQDSSGNYNIGESNVPTSGSNSFVSDGDTIVIIDDSGDVSYNTVEELGSTHIHTIGGSQYQIKFVFSGSTGGIINSWPIGSQSGGDPHIIPLGSNKVYDLPCKHGENYQYLAYKKHGESVVVNVMTQIVSFNAPKNKKLSKEIEEFISSCRDYVRYVYVCYSNSETGVKEEVCYDLFKLKCVSTNIKNFDTLAYNCRLPINKKSTKNLENIKLHKKVLKNRKVIGYKTNNKEEQFITVYTGSSKFDIMVGQAKNNLFGTYMSVEKYPQDVFVNGGGLLVHPTKTHPITCLKSGDKQERTNTIIVSRK